MRSNVKFKLNFKWNVWMQFFSFLQNLKRHIKRLRAPKVWVNTPIHEAMAPIFYLKTF